MSYYDSSLTLKVKEVVAEVIALPSDMATNECVALAPRGAIGQRLPALVAAAALVALGETAYLHPKR